MSIHPELDGLIDAHLDQTIDEEASERLRALIIEDPQASARLIERSRLSFQVIQVLRNEQSREAIDPLDLEGLQAIEPEFVELRKVDLQPKPVEKKQAKPWRQADPDTSKGVGFGVAGLSVYIGRGTDAGIPLRRILAYAAAIAFAAAVIWILIVPSNQQQAGQQGLAEDSDIDSPDLVEYLLAARQIGAVDPVWDGPSPSDAVGPEARHDFRLLSGFVELEFDRGARVVIEGPCAFKIIDDNSILVDQGKLVANVPASAKLFTVKTPSAEVIDFGTEFFVDVLEDGDTEVAVFTGLVELHENSKDSSQVTHQIALSAGQMSRVDSESGLDSNVKTFHPESMRSYVRQLEDATSVDVAYARLVRELKPVAYWPMIGDNPLLGESLESEDYALTAVGEAELERVQSPEAFADSQAIAIDGSNAFYIASPFDSRLWEDNEYSLSIWVRIDELSEQNIVAFVPSLRQRGSHYSNQIRTNAQGNLEHYTFCPMGLNPGLDNYKIVRTESGRPLEAERWAHLAATYGDGRSRLYLDGRLVAQERAKFNFENSYPTLLVGGATGYSRNDKAGDFKGAACQFVIFNRVLTPKEVKALSRPDQLKTK